MNKNPINQKAKIRFLTDKVLWFWSGLWLICVTASIHLYTQLYVPTPAVLSAVDQPVADTPTSSNSHQRLVGGIVPHHLLIKSQIIQFLVELQADQPQAKHLVVLLPNHHEHGGIKPVVATKDQEFWSKYAINSNVAYNDNTITQEESVDTWQTLLHDGQLDWQLHPILVSASTSDDDWLALQNLIHELISQNILVITSVDFSHYRSLQDAEQFDQQTQKAMVAYNLSEILTYNNDHVDSPKILALAVSLARDHEFEFDWRWHGNSQNAQPLVDEHNTTSYFIVGFVQ